jgi:hypothetical protein
VFFVIVRGLSARLTHHNSFENTTTKTTWLFQPEDGTEGTRKEYISE